MCKRQCSPLGNGSHAWRSSAVIELQHTRGRCTPLVLCVLTPSHFSVKSVQDRWEVLTVSGSIWSVSYTASGGLIRSSGVSIFLDLSLLVFVNFYSVGFPQAGFAFSLRWRGVLFSTRRIGVDQPRPILRRVVIGLLCAGWAGGSACNFFCCKRCTSLSWSTLKFDIQFQFSFLLFFFLSFSAWFEFELQ